MNKTSLLSSPSRHRNAFHAELGVPLNNIFEHLEATIGEATPLYELCASVLQPASD